MSYSYDYHERENGETVHVKLPETRQEAFAWYHEIQELAETDPVAWRAAVRIATASDLYMCGLFMTFWWDRDPFHGRAEIDCDFQFTFARWVQFESDDTVDYTARGHGKTTWSQVRITQEVVRDPNITIGIFSFDLQKGAQKHLTRWKLEIESNEILTSAWSDVFYKKPQEEGASWSIAHGLTVKRTLTRGMPTVSAWTFMKGLPTGARFGIVYFDDVETEETVESEEQRDKLVRRFQSALNLGGRRTRRWIVGTFHHPGGLLDHLIKQGWASHCFQAEDTTKPAPDIAEIYDACNGIRPDTGAKIPIEVRSVKLRGAPVYLHPLECAIARWDRTDAVYETQFMGDPLAGQTLRFRPEWVADNLRIKGDLKAWAQGKIGYLLSDPSKGLHDPSVGLVLVTDSDMTITLVDGFRRKLSPSEWCQEMYSFAALWGRIVELRQIRVEVFGQATWDHNLRVYFDAQRFNGPPIYPCGTGAGQRKSPDGTSIKLLRAWTRLEPLFRTAKLRLPTELLTLGDRAELYDLVAYFLDHEYSKFPLPRTDDILDTLALIDEPAEKCPPIEFPDRRVPWETQDDEDRPHPGLMPGIDEESFLWA